MSTALRSQLPTSYAPRQNRLRELGIFELPDKRRFVVSALYADGCCLYSVGAWSTFGVAEYWLDVDGRLIRHGRLTQWGVEDLRDTGLTASYPAPRIL